MAHPSRRHVLAGLAASAVIPAPSWADVGHPAYVAAALRPDGTHTLCGLSDLGHLVFEQSLPARGHAAAAHPFRPEAVAFARRPGTFAVVMDCRDGSASAVLESPSERHFCGHGVFSADGSLLFTTENAYELGEGRLGVWDAAGSYRRLGELPSHGIGPHEVVRLPGADTLVVANGGIETHPASGRVKLNLGRMEPSLAYVTPDGALLDKVVLDAKRRDLSIRHLSVRPDGLVAAACQWEGAVAQAPALLFLHRMGGDPEFRRASDPDHGKIAGYAGSVAFSGDGQRVAITGPRGGLMQCFEVDEGGADLIPLPDGCGVAAVGEDFLFTSGHGDILAHTGRTNLWRTHLDRKWDNHLVALI
ncbi:MAG: DUF1513 domain-containing protein [Pseudomonadota bacterium]